LRSLDWVRIGEILQTSGGEFVADEVGSPNW